MPEQSLLPAEAYVVEATQRFSEAARCVMSGSTSSAEPIIAGLDHVRLRSYWDAVMAKPAGLTLPSSAGKAPVKGSRRAGAPGAELERQVSAEDGWRCRWCGSPVIARHALRRMHLVFPVAFPRDSTNAGRHGLILAASASLDHVVPLARGGSNERENLVTACWPCQFARADWTLDEVGLEDPRSRAARLDGWDGVAWFRD